MARYPTFPEEPDDLEWDNYVCAVVGCGNTAAYEGWVKTYRTDGTLSGLIRIACVCEDHANLLVGWKGEQE